MRLYKSEFADRLIVVGPCSLYAYEAEAAPGFSLARKRQHLIGLRLLLTMYLLLHPYLI